MSKQETVSSSPSDLLGYPDINTWQPSGEAANYQADPELARLFQEAVAGLASNPGRVEAQIFDTPEGRVRFLLAAVRAEMEGQQSDLPTAVKEIHKRYAVPASTPG